MNDNRRDLQLHKSLVKGALPEHFQSNYPNLVKFLEYYYEFMRTEESFDDIIGDIIKTRDLIGIDDEYFKFAMAELTLGQDYSESISDPRLKSQLLSRWYRSKGSLYSIELFFRWMYGIDATVEYGKKSVFILNDSKIGPQSLKYIKNDKLYQTFAILIKAGIPVSQWRDAYKQFAHPAGLYYQGEVVIESILNLNYGIMPLVVLDGNAGTIVVENGAPVVGITTHSTITGLYNDSLDADGDKERLVLGTQLNDIEDLSIEYLSTNYTTIENLLSPNSPTFDAFDLEDGVNESVRFSSTIETFDQDVFDLVTIGDDSEPLLADSDISETTMDNIIFTFDSGRISFDRTL